MGYIWFITRVIENLYNLSFTELVRYQSVVSGLAVSLLIYSGRLVLGLVVGVGISKPLLVGWHCVLQGYYL